MLGDHPEAIEAALIAEYHHDYLAAYWRGEITLRKLRVLVQNLPPDSALARARHGHAWGDTEYMLAHIGDLLGVLAELTRCVNTENGSFNPPKPLPRPVDQAASVARDALRKRDVSAMHQTLSQLLPGRG